MTAAPDPTQPPARPPHPNAAALCFAGLVLMAAAAATAVAAPAAPPTTAGAAASAVARTLARGASAPPGTPRLSASAAAGKPARAASGAARASARGASAHAASSTRASGRPSKPQAIVLGADDVMPIKVAAALRASGVPLTNFGVYVQAADAKDAPVFAALNAAQPFMLASTAKVVTTLSALALLGPEHHWQTRAFTTAPVVRGRTAGDLILAGDGAGLTQAELRSWFKAMRTAGLAEIGGRIVLDHVSLFYEQDPAQLATTVEESAPEAAPEPPAHKPEGYNEGAIVVSVQPAASGPRAVVTIRPAPRGVEVVNEVAMGGGCNAWATWRAVPGSLLNAQQLWVRGRWEPACGRQDVAFVRPPAGIASAVAAASTRPALAAVSAAASAASADARKAGAARPPMSNAALVASLWTESGGRTMGGVVDSADLPPPEPAPRQRAQSPRVASPRVRAAVPAAPPRRWFSETTSTLAALVHEINKTSNNVAARALLLALGAGPEASPGDALRRAQARVREWLASQGVADGDIRIEVGSGQSRDERGTPRAMVQLLQKAWRAPNAQPFVESLPVAGVDGTLVNRMKKGVATGGAFLKTGTLHDVRALAGYVLAKSGKVYAVAVLVNHDAAARATPAMDAFIEWVARNG